MLQPAIWVVIGVVFIIVLAWLWRQWKSDAAEWDAHFQGRRSPAPGGQLVRKKRKRATGSSPSAEHLKGEIIRDIIHLGMKVEQLIQQRNWGESRRHIEANPELLSPKVEGIFDDLATMHRDHGPDVLRAIEEHRQLLRRCREQGIEAAFKRYRRG